MYLCLSIPHWKCYVLACSVLDKAPYKRVAHCFLGFPDRLRQLVLAYLLLYRFHYLTQAQHLWGMFVIQHILSYGLRGASMDT